MADQVFAHGSLSLKLAAHHIAMTYDPALTTLGGGIIKEVRDQFEHLHGGTIVWSQGLMGWRLRQPGDSPGGYQP
jgi:hypothetical protein